MRAARVRYDQESNTFWIGRECPTVEPILDQLCERVPGATRWKVPADWTPPPELDYLVLVPAEPPAVATTPKRGRPADPSQA